MHSARLELTKLTYTRLEDNLIRHRGDRPMCATPGRYVLLPVAASNENQCSSAWLHVLDCFRECAVTAAAADKPAPPPAPGSFSSLLVADIWAVANTVVEQATAVRVCCMQTARRVAAEDQHTLLQQLWTKSSGRNNVHLLTAVSRLTE